jgi:hypothetical protein
MRRPLAFAVLALPILMATACSKGGDQPGPGTATDPPGGRPPGPGSSSGAGSAATAGQLELLLVDAPNDEAKQIVVTIARVEAHVAGNGWVILLEQNRTVDLLSLRGGTFASLGVTSFPAGRVTQIRLALSAAGPNHVVARDNNSHPLELPSGVDSVLKINAGFDWPPCAAGMMTIDFDGKQSLIVRPRGGDGGEDIWQLRPVIHLRSVEHDGGKCGGGGPPPDGGQGNGMPDAGKGKGNGNGKGKPDDPGGQGKGHGDGGGKPDDPPGRDKPDAAASAVPRACANVTCPMGAQFCLNGTCHDVMAP